MPRTAAPCQKDLACMAKAWFPGCRCRKKLRQREKRAGSEFPVLLAFSGSSRCRRSLLPGGWLQDWRRFSRSGGAGQDPAAGSGGPGRQGKDRGAPASEGDVSAKRGREYPPDHFSGHMPFSPGRTPAPSHWKGCPTGKGVPHAPPLFFGAAQP
mgnify:CR=1 FL=1